MRINKYLALCGIGSRRKVEDFIKDGQVAVNGKVVTNLATDINVKKDKVMHNGVTVSLPNKYVYYKFNKPKANPIKAPKFTKAFSSFFMIIKINFSSSKTSIELILCKSTLSQ